jgi:hypothetical protein
MKWDFYLANNYYRILSAIEPSQYTILINKIHDGCGTIWRGLSMVTVAQHFLNHNDLFCRYLDSSPAMEDLLLIIYALDDGYARFSRLIAAYYEEMLYDEEEISRRFKNFKESEQLQLNQEENIEIEQQEVEENQQPQKIEGKVLAQKREQEQMHLQRYYQLQQEYKEQQELHKEQLKQQQQQQRQQIQQMPHQQPQLPQQRQGGQQIHQQIQQLRQLQQQLPQQQQQQQQDDEEDDEDDFIQFNFNDHQPPQRRFQLFFRNREQLQELAHLQPLFPLKPIEEEEKSYLFNLSLLSDSEEENPTQLNNPITPPFRFEDQDWEHPDLIHQPWPPAQPQQLYPPTEIVEKIIIEEMQLQQQQQEQELLQIQQQQQLKEQLDHFNYHFRDVEAYDNALVLDDYYSLFLTEKEDFVFGVRPKMLIRKARRYQNEKEEKAAFESLKQKKPINLNSIAQIVESAFQFSRNKESLLEYLLCENEHLLQECLSRAFNSPKDKLLYKNAVLLLERLSILFHDDVEKHQTIENFQKLCDAFR